VSTLKPIKRRTGADVSKPSVSKPSYHHGDLRSALLSAAHTLLETQTAAELSLREAAKVANVSPAAPYRHFANKDALLAALAEEGFDELDQVLRAAAQRIPAQPRAQLTELADAYLRLAVNRPHFFRMMFSIDLGPSRVDEGIVRACDRVQQGLVQALAQSLGAVSDAQLELSFLHYWSTLHGYAMLLIDHKLDELELTLAQHSEKLAAILTEPLGGLAPPRSRKRLPAGRAASAKGLPRNSRLHK
jgi:AcrR family transcriptional regulator